MFWKPVGISWPVYQLGLLRMDSGPLELVKCVKITDKHLVEINVFILS
jgi:hypothetical protein